jgi:hypothetical protein
VDLRIRSLVVQLQPQALQQHARPIVYHSVREQKIALAGRSNKKWLPQIRRLLGLWRLYRYFTD